MNGKLIIVAIITMTFLGVRSVSAQVCGAVNASNTGQTSTVSNPTPVYVAPYTPPDPCAGNNTCGQCGIPDCYYDPAPSQTWGNVDERQAVSAPSEPALVPADNTPQQVFESFFDWGPAPSYDPPPSNDCWYCYDWI